MFLYEFVVKIYLVIYLELGTHAGIIKLLGLYAFVEISCRFSFNFGTYSSF